MRIVSAGLVPIVLAAGLVSPVDADAADTLDCSTVIVENAPAVSFTLVPGESPAYRFLQACPLAADRQAINSWQLLVDGVVVDEQAGSSTEPLRWDPPSGLARTVSAAVRVVPETGIPVDLPAVTANIDTVAPTASFVSPAAGAYLRGNIAVTVSSPDKNLGTVAVNGHALEPVSGTNLWRGAVPPADRLDLVVIDWAANTTRLSRSVVADNAVPVVSTITPAEHAWVRGTVTSTLSGISDKSGVAKAELWAYGQYVGRDTTAPFALPVRTTVAHGLHDVQLIWKVTDRAGNSVTHYRTVSVDNDGPKVSITKAPRNKAKVKGTVTVSVKASDARGVARVELIVNGKVVARDAKAGYALSVKTGKQKKTMKVRVRAYDKLGNVTYTSTRTWYRK